MREVLRVRAPQGFPVVMIVAVAALASSTIVHASIGGTAASVESDRVRMQGALRQIVRTGPYTLHEMQSASGIVVREYVSDEGTVFAIAWEGATFPDMRQLLGQYFERYRAEAERLSRTRKGHGPLTVDLGDLVVQSAGHNRAFSGRVFLPQAAPRGIGIESIR